VIAADPQARVYVAANAYDGAELYGCVNGSRRSYGLGPVAATRTTKYMETSYGGTRGVVLAGSFVAYEEIDRPSVGLSHWGVVVRDLRGGRAVRDEPTGPEGKIDAFGIGPTTGLLLTSNGSVAWIVTTILPEEGGYQLRSVGATGNRLLARGPDIRPSSLALAGSTLYWTQGGTPMPTALD
jgi:hypothetical protein